MNIDNMDIKSAGQPRAARPHLQELWVAVAKEIGMDLGRLRKMIVGIGIKSDQQKGIRNRSDYGGNEGVCGGVKEDESVSERIEKCCDEVDLISQRFEDLGEYLQEFQKNNLKDKPVSQQRQQQQNWQQQFQALHKDFGMLLSAWDFANSEIDRLQKVNQDQALALKIAHQESKAAIDSKQVLIQDLTEKIETRMSAFERFEKMNQKVQMTIEAQYQKARESCEKQLRCEVELRGFDNRWLKEEVAMVDHERKLLATQLDIITKENNKIKKEYKNKYLLELPPAPEGKQLIDSFQSLIIDTLGWAREFTMNQKSLTLEEFKAIKLSPEFEDILDTSFLDIDGLFKSKNRNTQRKIRRRLVEVFLLGTLIHESMYEQGSLGLDQDIWSEFQETLDRGLLFGTAQENHHWLALSHLLLSTKDPKFPATQKKAIHDFTKRLYEQLLLFIHNPTSLGQGSATPASPAAATITGLEKLVEKVADLSFKFAQLPYQIKSLMTERFTPGERFSEHDMWDIDRQALRSAAREGKEETKDDDNDRSGSDWDQEEIHKALSVRSEKTNDSGKSTDSENPDHYHENRQITILLCYPWVKKEFDSTGKEVEVDKMLNRAIVSCMSD